MLGYKLQTNASTFVALRRLVIKALSWLQLLITCTAADYRRQQMADSKSSSSRDFFEISGFLIYTFGYLTNQTQSTQQP